MSCKIILDITDDLLDNIDSHVEEILKGEFIDIEDGEVTFKNIQVRGEDIVYKKVSEIFTRHEVVTNFIRKSPKYQDEPNFIHHDGMMGDITAILFLNKEYPDESGTVFYENIDTKEAYCRDITQVNDGKSFRETMRVKMRYNRLLVFPSRLYHSRSLEENFGEDDNNSRLVQVLFLNLK